LALRRIGNPDTHRRSCAPAATLRTGQWESSRLIGGTAPDVILEVEGCYSPRIWDKTTSNRIFKPRPFL